MNYHETYRTYVAEIDGYLRNCLDRQVPHSLYAPMKYVLEGGGKRIRPILTMLSCEVVGGRAQDALYAGAAIEILHNFTLVHDDIMDNASSRRGRKSVHVRWDENVAILAGDALLALAYRHLLKTNSPRIQEVTAVFTEGVIEVCEGQAYDKEFETRRKVSGDDYLHMIGKKTGAMVAVSTVIGGLIGNAGDGERRALQRYGELVGTAFQIQDDLLDIVGDEKKFGKVIGGDVQEGKKTFLFLEALKRSRGKDREVLVSMMRNGGVPRSRVQTIRRIYERTGAIDAARVRVGHDLMAAKDALREVRGGEATGMLEWFSDMLLERTF